MTDIKTSCGIDIFSPRESINIPRVDCIKDDGCICSRPKGHVLCRNCGYLGRGRVKIACRQHPNVRFINDYDGCPKCSMADMLAEI